MGAAKLLPGAARISSAPPLEKLIDWLAATDPSNLTTELGPRSVVPTPIRLPVISSVPGENTLLATVPSASKVPRLSIDAASSPSPISECPFSTTILPASKVPDVPTSTDEFASTHSVEPLHTAIAPEMRMLPPAVAEMVPLPGNGAARDPPIDRPAAATVPLLTRITPAGSIAVSPATGGPPDGDQFPEIVHAEAVVAVHVYVVPAIVASRNPSLLRNAKLSRHGKAMRRKQNVAGLGTL